MLRVLLIEPYYGGSHRVWADGYRRFSSHHVELLTLPAQFWKWRMQGGAVTLARWFHDRDQAPDVILASDMLDLSIFRALTGPQRIPCAFYFHENQLTYPQNARQGHGWRYGFINYISALVADAVYFNSSFHLESFMDALPRMLKHFGDHNELDTVAEVRQKSSVLAPGLDLGRFDPYRPEQKRRDQPPLLVWNHRWEADKNPRLLFETLDRLMDSGIPFRAAIVGENFSQNPDEFEMARQRLGSRLIRYGYVESFEDYARLLWEADFVISTANQDFFGIAVAEAIYCGCLPLLPYRLNYPALIPESQRDTCLYSANDLYSLLLAHLEGQVTADMALLRNHIVKYDWRQMAIRYDTALRLLVQAFGSQADPGI